MEAQLDCSDWLAGDPLQAAKKVWKKADGGKKKGPGAAGALAVGGVLPSVSLGVETLRVAIEAADLLLWPSIKARALDRATSDPSQAPF